MRFRMGALQILTSFATRKSSLTRFTSMPSITLEHGELPQATTHVLLQQLLVKVWFVVES